MGHPGCVQMQIEKQFSLAILKQINECENNMTYCRTKQCRQIGALFLRRTIVEFKFTRTQLSSRLLYDASGAPIRVSVWRRAFRV